MVCYKDSHCTKQSGIAKTSFNSTISHRIISGGNSKHQKGSCMKKDKYQNNGSPTVEMLSQFIQKFNIPPLSKKYLPQRELLLFVVDSKENFQTNSDTYNMGVRHKYDLHVSNTYLGKYNKTDNVRIMRY
jgi:hypothetical protein